MRSALVICLLAGTARAGALASLSEDVDGNGTSDRVELTADGMVHIGDASKATVKVSSAVTKARIVTVKTATGVQLVVDLTSNSAREAVVLDRARGWHVVTRFPLGGVGLDREYGFELDTSTDIVRYQTRWDVTRCDDKPTLLFAEKLEGATFKKLDRIPTHVPAGTATLPAKLETGTAAPPVIFQARSASHQPGATDAGVLAIPRELDDGRNDTAWREDFASHGEGQFFTFKPRIDSARAQLLRIVPGQQRTTSRPRGMAIVSKQGAWRFELPDGAGEAPGSAYVIELPPAVGECVTVILESARGNGPTAIAELGVYAADERSGGAGPLLARVVAEGKSGATNAATALGRLGAAGVKAIDAELAKTTDATVRRRLIGALVKIKDPAATASLVRAASEGWVRDRDLIDVIHALRGQDATLRELASKAAIPVETRIIAVQQIAPNSPELVGLAGRGERSVRHAVIERLASGSLDALVQLATTQTEAAVVGDLWRAVTRNARHNAAGRPTAVAAMLAALPAATDYERRYRLIDGIATHGDATALAQLETALKALPAGAESAALRQVAIRGLAASPRIEAAPLVIAAAKDPDPGVRLAALRAIATSETDAAGAWHGPDGPDAIDRVVVNAMADAWPEIRRRAATALGSRCTRPGPARVLFYAVATDKELDVRIDSLVALVQCRANGVGDLLQVTWDSNKQPLPVRTQAIDLVVTLGDRQLARTLVAKFARWRGQAIESKEALVLAQSAAATIGRMRVPGAAQALLAALDDSAFPEIISAAALGLGALGPQCPAAAKAKLTLIARSDERSAVAAKHAAAQCGR